MNENAYLRDCTDTSLSCSVTCNLMFKKTGIMYSLHNIQYIKGMDLSAVERDKSDSDKIIEFLKEKGHKYVSLCHRDVASPESEGTSPLYCIIDEARDEGSLEYEIPTENERELLTYAQEHRCAYELTKEQHLFMGVAWMIDDECRRLELSPEVLHVDGTMCTNKQKCPLFTVTGKDRMGKQFIVMRALLPNQKAWAFRWLFSIVFPIFFSKSLLRRVNIIISDGDSQEYTQIDNAIKKFMPNAKRLRCGWHLVSKGWKRHCCNALNKEMIGDRLLVYKQITRLIKRWLYSWMRPGYCITIDEYTLSKRMLFLFIKSVADKIGEVNANRIIDFIRDYFEPHEFQYCFYLRMSIRHFSSYLNSGHEGTNNGIKHCYGAVVPRHALNKCVELLTAQGDRTSKLNEESVCVEVNHHKPWTSLKCGEKLLSKSESLQRQQWVRRKEYNVLKVQRMRWFVAWGGARDKSIIPIFNRTYIVESRDGYFFCSCKFYECNGYCCSHLLAVLSSCTGYGEPSHHDISITHWKEYYMYAFTRATDPGIVAISKMFNFLLSNDAVGPYHDPIKYQKDPIATHIPDQFSKGLSISCWNYDLSSINYLNASLGPFGVNQCTNLMGDIESSLLTNSNEFTGDVIEDECHELSVYEQLHPIFTELVNSLEDNDPTDISEAVKEFLNETIIRVKSEQVKRLEVGGKKLTQGRMISCNYGNKERRHNSHGTKHY